MNDVMTQQLRGQHQPPERDIEDEIQIPNDAYIQQNRDEHNSPSPRGSSASSDDEPASFHQQLYNVQNTGSGSPTALDAVLARKLNSGS